MAVTTPAPSPPRLSEAWASFVSVSANASEEEIVAFSTEVSAREFLGAYEALCGRTHPRLSFKTADCEELTTRLTDFFLDERSAVPKASRTNASFMKKMEIVARRCVRFGDARIVGPDAFRTAASAAVKCSKAMCEAVVRRKDEIEWDTPTGEAAPVSAQADRDWWLDPPSQAERVREIWRAMTSGARGKKLPNKSDFQVYARSSADGRPWLRFYYSAGPRQAAERAVEVDESEAVPDWLRVNSSRIRKLRDFLEKNATPGADPDCRSAVYALLVNDAFGAPLQWAVQAYVGETNETTAGRWFKPREAGHLKSVRRVLEAAASASSACPSSVLLVDVALAGCWLLSPEGWWERNVRLYVLSSTGADGPAEESSRVAKQDEFIDYLQLTHPSNGMNKKGKNKNK